MADQEPLDVVPVEKVEAPAPLMSEFGPQALSQAQERLKVIMGLKKLAISYTTTDEWKRFGDKPYLEATGALKFAEVFGVSFSEADIRPFNYSDERGPVTEFIARVMASCRGRTCQGAGVSSTAEEFWNGKEQDPNDPEKKRTRRLPMSEIDRPSVMKKAYTQACADAARKILGLSFTWDEVTAALGKGAANVGSVQFGGKSEFRGEEKKAGKGEMTPTKQELLSVVMEISMGDQEQAKETLFGLTKFTDKEGNERGSRSILEMSEKWASSTLPKAKKMLAKIREQEGANDVGPAA